MSIYHIFRFLFMFKIVSLVNIIHTIEDAISLNESLKHIL